MRFVVVVIIIVVVVGNHHNQPFMMMMMVTHQVEQDKNPPTKSYSYLGWSTGSGKVLPDSSRLAYISGAPRSLEIGQVGGRGC